MSAAPCCVWVRRVEVRYKYRCVAVNYARHFLISFLVYVYFRSIHILNTIQHLTTSIYEMEFGTTNGKICTIDMS
jgi:hypothetical protein